MTPSWRRAVRGALYDALFTGYRGYWLVRLAFAILLAEAAQASFGRIHTTTEVGAIGLACVLLGLPLVWFAYPVLGGRANVGSAMTILDEGVTVEANHSSLSVAWGAVRAVRRTLWDLVIVLDSACISVPLAGLTPGTVDSVLERFRRACEAPRDAKAKEPAPYRTAAARPPGPEDEDATPEEWRAPSQYRVSVLAFPTRAQNLLALISLKRGAFMWPGVMLGAAGFMLFIRTIPCDDKALLTLLMLVAAVTAAFAVGILGLVFSPGLLALRDRFVRERRAGVLYAVGPSGIYIRTQSFERRETWDGVFALRLSRTRVAIRSASLIHVIPLAAFTNEHDRKTFVKTIENEVAARLPPTPR